MNESQKRLTHMWRKWRDANGPDLDQYNGWRVKGTARYETGPMVGKTVLAMEEVRSEEHGWAKGVPVVVLVAPGNKFRVGEVIERYPIGTGFASIIFSKKKKAP